MTPEQLDNWFSYHAPTEETAPKYRAIRDAADAVTANVTMTHYEVGGDVKAQYDEINRATRRFAEVIDANAPDSADKTAAIRCVRLARNLFNEWATEMSKPKDRQTWTDPRVLFIHAEVELLKARMQANSAVACGGL